MLWRRTATSRRLVGVELLQVAHVLLLRPVATSCRSTQDDVSVLASTYACSRPTRARLRLIATSCSKAAIDLRFGRSEHSCVASCRQAERSRRRRSFKIKYVRNGFRNVRRTTILIRVRRRRKGDSRVPMEDRLTLEASIFDRLTTDGYINFS